MLKKLILLGLVVISKAKVSYQEAETWKTDQNIRFKLMKEFENSNLTQATLFDLEKIFSVERESNEHLNISDDDIPKTFDAREHWPKCTIIKNIPDQGACDSSHIFAAVAALNDRRCIISDGKHNEELSTEYVASCCKICRYYEDQVCGYGSLFKAWEFLHKRGAVTGSHYGVKEGCQPSTVEPCAHYGESNLKNCANIHTPTPKCHTRCTNDAYNKDFFDDKHRSTKAQWVKENEAAIQKEILAYGPASAAMVLYEDLYHYKKGVYQHSSSSKLEKWLHSAKIIGWGTENNVPYWLLINTWGPKWGDNGTFKILRGQYECYIEYLVAVGRPKNKN